MTFEENVDLGAQLDEPQLTIHVDTWLARVDGETSLVRDLGGDEVSLNNTLDFSREWTPNVEVRWQVARKHALNFSLFYLDSNNETTVRRGLIIDDVALPLIAEVESDAKFLFLGADWHWRILEWPEYNAGIETIAGVLGFHVDLEYEAYLPGFEWVGGLPGRVREGFRDAFGSILPDSLSFLNTSIHYDDREIVTAGTPVIGLRAFGEPIDRVGFDVSAKGMYLGGLGNLVDASAAVELRVWRQIYVEAGYRYWRAEADFSGEEYEIEFRGPYLGASVRF